MTNDDRIDKLAAFVRKLAQHKDLSVEDVQSEYEWGETDAFRTVGKLSHAVLKECGLA